MVFLECPKNDKHWPASKFSHHQMRFKISKLTKKERHRTRAAVCMNQFNIAVRTHWSQIYSFWYLFSSSLLLLLTLQQLQISHEVDKDTRNPQQSWHIYINKIKNHLFLLLFLLLAAVVTAQSIFIHVFLLSSLLLCFDFHFFFILGCSYCNINVM